jgi:hypothetical protein
MRLRLRSAILFILALLTVFFLITLYTLIWSTNELERQDKYRDQPIPPGVIPFWSAINHQNIYDLHAIPANTVFIRSTNITQRRIEELYQLIRNARTDETHSIEDEKRFPVDPKWNFDKLVEQQQSPEQREKTKQNPETHADTADSAAKITKSTIPPDLTTTEKTVSEYDKIQLRNYIHQVISKWKKEHHNDKIITIADLMREELEKDEPLYVIFIKIFILDVLFYV